MKTHLQTVVSGMLAAILALGLLCSCNKSEVADPNLDDQVAPELPPEASFIIPFDDFSDTTALSLPDGFAKSPAGPNHTVAFWKVTWWNAILTLNLFVPAAAYLEAFQHDATWETDRWIWSYSFQALVTYQAELHAIPGTDGVSWEMYISRENSFQDFLWYSGFSNLTLTEGTWMLYHSPDNPVAYLDVLWHYDHGTNTGDIRYTYLLENVAEKDSYIFYGSTSDATHNRFYEIFNSVLPNHVNIEWHSEDKNGRISDPHHFGDTDWHCWDETLADVDCP